MLCAALHYLYGMSSKRSMPFFHLLRARETATHDDDESLLLFRLPSLFRAFGLLPVAKLIQS
jgi:hypothetical protein